VRKWQRALVGAALTLAMWAGGAVALPSVEITLAGSQGAVGDTLSVWAGVRVDDWDRFSGCYAFLAELEYPAALSFVDVVALQGDHVTVNPATPGACGEPPGVRFILLDLVPLDLSKPLAEVRFVASQAGAWRVGRTCWTRGAPHPIVGAYTFAGDVTLVGSDPMDGWDVLDEYPETGQMSWGEAWITAGDVAGVETAAPTWGAVKALWR